MNVKSAISAFALAAALGFSGSAMAQVSINGTPVPETEVEAVTEACAALAAGDTATAADSGATTSVGSAQPSGGNQEAQPGAVNSADPQNPSIDLETLTAEECEEAGFGGDDGASTSTTSGSTSGTGTTGSTGTASGSTTGGSAAGTTGAATSVGSDQPSGGNQESQPGAVNSADPQNTTTSR